MIGLLALQSERWKLMKDSKEKWIGSIPDKWDIKRGKNILALLERPVLETDGVITCFRDGEVTLRSNRREEGFTFSLQEVGYQGIEVGDLVVHGMDGFAGAIGISDSRGKATPVLNVLDSAQDKKYLMYYLRCAAYCGLFLSLSTGIRVRSCDTNWNKLKNIIYLVPSLNEQRRIADFLDRRCAEIDGVIEATKKTIEEYKALKQSIITEAVTKGVRGARPMKDSGIEWIGEIPAEWAITKFKNLGRCRNGLTYAPEEQCGEDGILVLRSSNIQNGKLTLDDCVYVNKRIPNDLMVHPNDILICSRNGSAKLIGKNAIIPDGLTASFGAFMMIYRCESPRYLQYVLSSHIFNYYLGTFLTVSVNQLTGKSFDNISFPYTSNKEEQAEIIEYLDTMSEHYDHLIARKQELLIELEIYKKSVIYEYVTGKREVL